MPAAMRRWRWVGLTVEARTKSEARGALKRALSEALGRMVRRLPPGARVEEVPS